MLRHKAYGNRIRLLRDARSWTQQQLARAAGYSIKTIYKAELGRALKRQTLADIAQALGVSIEEIAQLPATPKPRARAIATTDPPASGHKSSDKVPSPFRHRS
jgi:transcriptional regulator with XRE-family HTH domain